MTLEQAQKLVGEVVEVKLKDGNHVGLLWFVGRNEFLNRLQINIGYSTCEILEVENYDNIRQVTKEELESFDVKSFKQTQEYLKTKNENIYKQRS